MFNLLGDLNLVLAAGYGMVFLAVFVLVRQLVTEQEVRTAQETLEDQRSRATSTNALVRITRPIFSQYVVPVVRGKQFWAKQRLNYRRKLISAGLRDELTPDEFIAFKLFNILFFPIVFGVLQAMEMIDVPISGILFTGPLGWFYPDLWVISRIRSRHRAVKKAFPFIVDLLALSTEAGLDFMGSIGKVVEKAKPSPLVDEFQQVLKEIKVGSSRSEALREMAVRVDMPEINSFIAILISAEQMGASIGKTLRQQSEQVRIQRFLEAEKAGASATQKLTIVTMVVVLPCVFIMTIGPFVLSLISSGGI